MELKINFNGKEYLITNEGFYATILFKRTTGKEIYEMGGLEDSLIFIWCFFKAGACIYKYEFDYELEDFLMLANQKLVDDFSKLNQQVEEVEGIEKKNQE
jgi:hypothetical protein